MAKKFNNKNKNKKSNLVNNINNVIKDDEEIINKKTSNNIFINIFRNKNNILIALFLWISSSALFISFPVSQVTDGRFMLLLSNAMVFDNTTRLDPYIKSINRELEPQKSFFYYWWQLSPKRDGKIEVRHNGEWDGFEALYYRYPNLPSVLSIPAVVVMDSLGINIVREGRFSFIDENLAHRILAGLICGFIVAQIYFLARLALPIPWSIFITIVCSFGTQIVSTLSRGVWSDTWALLISLFAVHHLLAHSLNKVHLRPIFLAIISALAFFCKPNYAVVGIISVVYVSVEVLKTGNKKMLYWLLSVGGAFALAFMLYSFYQFGTPIPDYYRPAIDLKFLPPALIGHTFSPSRGLFIYSSYLLMVIYFLLFYAKENLAPSLTKLTLIPITILVFVSSAWGTWWGGHSYGPRLIIPLLPWTILLSVLAMAAFLRAKKKLSPVALKINYGLLILTTTLSVMINVHGARENKTWLEWFYTPYPVFNNPQGRLWDWRDAQFLAGIFPRPHQIK